MSDEKRSVTDRERRMLSLAAQGLSDREIAADLALAEKTVKNCMYGLYRLLGVHNRTQAVVKAIKRGDIPLTIRREEKAS